MKTRGCSARSGDRNRQQLRNSGVSSMTCCGAVRVNRLHDRLSTNNIHPCLGLRGDRLRRSRIAST
jgi:hypothetical protein